MGEWSGAGGIALGTEGGGQGGAAPTHLATPGPVMLATIAPRQHAENGQKVQVEK